MNGQYYFYMKNGMTLTVDNIKVIGNTMYMYAERMISNINTIACVSDIQINEFKKSFKYMETVVKNNMFIKHYEEI